MEKEGDKSEWAARAKHHAKKLLPLAKVAEEIFENATDFKLFKSRLRVYTPTATYMIRPYQKKGVGYIGIEIKEYGSNRAIRLKVVEAEDQE